MLYYLGSGLYHNPVYIGQLKIMRGAGWRKYGERKEIMLFGRIFSEGFFEKLAIKNKY